MPSTTAAAFAPTRAFAKPGDLRANGFNTNVVSPDNEAKIDASITRLGMFKDIIVRTLPNGTLEILGGEHRRDAAIRLGMTSIPITNLGVVSDARAKEISLVDNARFGDDDTVRLAELLDELGGAGELGSFLPYSDSDFASIFASTTIALDDLELPGDDAIAAPIAKAVQTHTLMRFKVPVGDVAVVTEAIERIMREQSFKDDDSLTNAGHALVHLLAGVN